MTEGTERHISTLFGLNSGRQCPCRRSTGIPFQRCQLSGRRQERVERSFAHVCETGGARRTWLRGLAKINKRYSMVAAAHNLGLMMRKLFGSGKPREAAATGLFARLFDSLLATLNFLQASTRNHRASSGLKWYPVWRAINGPLKFRTRSQMLRSSTAC